MNSAPDLALRWNLRRSGPRGQWRGACPLCGYPTALVLTERTGRALAWCASCQNGAGLAALMRGEPATTAPYAAPVDRNGEPETQRKQERALRLWEAAQATPGTLGATYLTARALPALAASTALRFVPSCGHPEGGRWPALVALVRDTAGRPVAVHRTYLRRDGTGKANVEPAKASLGPVWGGAIRLNPLAPELAIGEGIESSAAAGLLIGLPAWAAISAGNLGTGLVLPPEVRAVVIAADPDPPGEAAAQDAARRWTGEGRHVRIARPTGPGDFADLLAEARNV